MFGSRDPYLRTSALYVSGSFFVLNTFLPLSSIFMFAVILQDTNKTSQSRQINSKTRLFSSWNISNDISTIMQYVSMNYAHVGSVLFCFWLHSAADCSFTGSSDTDSDLSQFELIAIWFEVVWQVYFLICLCSS